MKRIFTLLAITAAFASASVTGQALPEPQESQPFSFLFSESVAPVMIAPDAQSDNPFLVNMPTMNTSIAGCVQKRIMTRTDDANDDLPEIYGAVISSNPYRSYGMKRLPMREGDDFTDVPGMAGTGMSQVTSGAEKDGVFYTNNIVSRYGQLYCVYYMTWNMTTWMRDSYCQSSDFLGAARDMATDPVTGEIYGCFMKTHAGLSYVLAKVDYEVVNPSSVVPHRTTICDLDNMLTALFFTADGQLWGIDLITGPDDNNKDECKSASLYKIDKNTGAMTLVGETGAKPYYVSSATCDIYGDGKVYWAIKGIDNVGSLYTVDLTTGEATKMFDFPKNEEVVAMHVPMRPSDKAPSTPSELKIDFPEGKLTGTLSMEIPAILNDGTDGEGDCQYEFYLNGNVIASGKAPYGGTASANIEVDRAGNYTFVGRLKNDDGYSQRVQNQMYIGTGTPASPTPALALTGGKAYLMWESVTAAPYGYINPDEILYDIRRSDGEMVAENISATQFIEPFEASQFTMLYYEVRSKWGENVSGFTKSNIVATGKITPPFTETFDNPYLVGTSGTPWLDIETDNSTLGHWYIHTQEWAACASTGFGQEDSWLISPAIALEAGKTYYIGFDQWGNFDTKPTQFEVKLGTGPSPLAMLQEIIPMTSRQNKKATAEYFGQTFTVGITGDYYLGLHCYTPNGGPSLFIDNLSIEELTQTGFPSKPNTLTVTPASKTSLTVNLSVCAPTKSREGSALTGTLDINIERDGQIIKTFKGIAPSKKVEFSETVAKGGSVIYSASASNSVGTSPKVSTEVYLGVYAPRPVKSATLTRSDDNASWIIAWEPNLQDTKWNTLTTADITYTIVAPGADGETVVVADNIDGATTSYTIPDANADGPAKFVQYGVIVNTDAGTSSVVATNIGTTGRAYSTPYDESFVGRATGIMYSTTINGSAQWFAVSDSDLPGITSSDGDGGFMAMFASYQNSQSGLCTAFIDLAGLETPGLTLRTFNLTQNNVANLNKLQVFVSTGDGTFTPVRANADIIGSLGMPNQWVKYSVSLEQYKGQKVQIMIAATATTYTAVMIDELHIGEISPCDLTALSIYGDATIAENENGNFTVTLVNNGYDIADFNVDLLRDGSVVATETYSGLEPGLFAQINLTDRPDVDSSNKVRYSARINAEGDNDTDDNEIGPISVGVILPAYPTVEDLAAEASDSEGIALSWSDPGTDYMPNPTTESFEKADPWGSDIEGWKVVDVDQQPVSMGSASGLFGDLKTGDQLGFIVAQADPTKSMNAHLGSRFILKFAPATEYGDDWIISPELFGTSQTITIWARSYAAQTPDNVEILYSEGSDDPSDFVSLAKFVDVPTLWTPLSVELPDGAKRFAVRSYSVGTFMLHLDDFRYVGTPLALSLTGYHVWRDGVRLTSEPVSTTTFVDNDGQPGMKYRVSAIFDAGESRPGNEAWTEPASITDVNADATVTITTGHHSVIVGRADGSVIEIWTPEGRLVRRVEATAATTVIPVNQGIYVVKAANTTAKVVVR